MKFNIDDVVVRKPSMRDYGWEHDDKPLLVVEVFESPETVCLPQHSEWLALELDGKRINPHGYWCADGFDLVRRPATGEKGPSPQRSAQ